MANYIYYKKAFVDKPECIVDASSEIIPLQDMVFGDIIKFYQTDNNLAQYYLLRNVNDSDAILMELMGIKLLKVDDNAIRLANNRVSLFFDIDKDIFLTNNVGV